jgi:tetratricopeptide (TPR) repeat protein
MAVSEVIMAAARRIPSPGRALEALGRGGALRAVEASVLVESSGLTPEDAYLLSRFHGGCTIERALAAAGIAEEAALGSVVGLIESGLLEADGEDYSSAQEAVRDEVHRMYELLQRKDPWRALGLPLDVGIETARAAFREAVRKYHPDRYQAMSDPAFQGELARVCESFTSAFTCLTTALKLRGSAAKDSAIALASTAVERPATEPPPPPLPPKEKTEAPASCDAEVYFKEGRRAMERKEYFRAIELLRVSVEKRGDHAPYHFFLAEALARNPRWRHEAEESYLRAIDLDPHHLEYYAALRKLYEAAGLHHRAESVQHRAEAMGVSGVSFRGVA